MPEHQDSARATPEESVDTEEHNHRESSPSTVISDHTPVIIEPDEEMEEEIEPPETKELEMTLKSSEDHRVKKCIATYETRVFRSRDPSPAPSHGSYTFIISPLIS